MFLLQSIRSDERILKVSAIIAWSWTSSCCNQFDPMRGYWKRRPPLQRLKKGLQSCNQFDPMRGYWKSLKLCDRGCLHDVLQSIRSDERILKHIRNIPIRNISISCNQFDPMRGYWKDFTPSRFASFLRVAINSIRWEDTEANWANAKPIRTQRCNQFDPMRGYWSWNAHKLSWYEQLLLQSIRSDERILKLWVCRKLM